MMKLSNKNLGSVMAPKSVSLVILLSMLLTGCNGASLSPKGEDAQQSTVDQRAAASADNGGDKISARNLESYKTRDIKDEVFYFVLPDRFYNGDRSNDLGSLTKAISHGGFDPADINSYHGGDLTGLTQKLPYLEQMGITAIWLTPILRNQAVQGNSTGYHGYWVLDFTEIDPHLGTNAELKQLIAAAHQRNIKIFFDIITNHTADVIKYSQCHGNDGALWSDGNNLCPYKSLTQLAKGDSYTTVIPQGAEQLKSPAWLNDPKYYHNQGDSTFSGENSLYGDFVGLDDLNTDDPQVVSGMIDIFKNLISEFKPDGFRIDTVKHVNIEFWQQFSPALINHAQSIGLSNFFIFGEVYSGDAKELSKYTTIGKLPSVLDFGFQGAIYQTLVAQQGTDRLQKLFDNDSLYLDSDSSADNLLNFVGNHDMGRFAQMLAQSEYQYSEDQQIKRNMLAHGLMYFSRGIPVIYYGAEQGFVGDGGDSGARQDMMSSQVATYNDDKLLATDKTTADDNFDQQHLFYRTFADFSKVYQAYPALRRGKHQTRYAQTTPGIYAFSRGDEPKQQEHLVVVNTATTEQVVTLDARSDSYKLLYRLPGANPQLSVAKSQLTISLPALSLAIYQAQ